jgi:hypothetical protein
MKFFLNPLSLNPDYAKCTLIPQRHSVLFSTAILIVSKATPEAEFLDVIGTKVLNVFFFANQSHLY